MLTRFNTRLENGKLYYLLGHVYLALDEQEKSYDYFRKAAWSSAYVSSAMTYAAMLDIRKLEYDKAVQHLTTAITYHKDNAVANALMIYASYCREIKSIGTSISVCRSE